MSPSNQLLFLKNNGTIILRFVFSFLSANRFPTPPPLYPSPIYPFVSSITFLHPPWYIPTKWALPLTKFDLLHSVLVVDPFTFGCQFFVHSFTHPRLLACEYHLRACCFASTIPIRARRFCWLDGPVCARQKSKFVEQTQKVQVLVLITRFDIFCGNCCLLIAFGVTQPLKQWPPYEWLRCGNSD